MIPMFSKLFLCKSLGVNDQQAITFNVQLEQYKNVSTLLVKELGVLLAQELISRSLFLISTGINDIIYGYLTSPTTQIRYNATQYITPMLESYKSGIEVSFHHLHITLLT